MLLERGATVDFAIKNKKSWRALVNSGKLSPAIRTMLAQRSPQLFRELDWSALLPDALTSISDLIFVMHTFLPRIPRRFVLDIVYQELATKTERK